MSCCSFTGGNLHPGGRGRASAGHLGQHVRAQQLKARTPRQATGYNGRYRQHIPVHFRSPPSARQYLRWSVQNSN